VVVDGKKAFVGGINYSADHLADYGPRAKQDYAVQVEGPLVAQIHRFARSALPSAGRRWPFRRALPAPVTEPTWAGDALGMLVIRDNDRHPNDIERHGAWLGGIGFRYRLYSQLGVSPATTARLYLSTLVTNWTGYVAVAGVAFAFYGLDLPDEWRLSDNGLRWIGVVLAAVVAPAFLVACVRARRRSRSVRGHEFEVPDGRLAAGQMAVGALNWLLIGAVIWSLLPHGGQAPHYGTVLATYLIAAIAGVVTHIPAGLGVLEAVFLALLGHRVSHAQLLGALLAYRALYYLVPLALAGLAYALLESRIKRQ
jgi:hypothetical protein